MPRKGALDPRLIVRVLAWLGIELDPDDVPPVEVGEKFLDKVGAGRRSRALSDIVLADFRDAVRRGETPEAELLLYVSEAFDEILSGSRPDAVFGRARRGRPRSFPDVRNLQIAVDYLALIASGGKRDAAYLELADRFHVSESTIAKTVRPWHELFGPSLRAAGVPLASDTARERA